MTHFTIIIVVISLITMNPTMLCASELPHNSQNCTLDTIESNLLQSFMIGTTSFIAGIVGYTYYNIQKKLFHAIEQEACIAELNAAHMRATPITLETPTIRARRKKIFEARLHNFQKYRSE